jgi:hypothetical protein
MAAVATVPDPDGGASSSPMDSTAILSLSPQWWRWQQAAPSPTDGCPVALPSFHRRHKDCSGEKSRAWMRMHEREEAGGGGANAEIIDEKFGH